MSAATPGSSTTRPVTVSTVRGMKQAGEKIACLTVYDASFTKRLEEAGVEVLLVGDSLGMVIQGHDSTQRVRLEDMAYHTRCVARARGRALLVVDLPLLTYSTPALALESAAQLVREGGAQVLKLEGGRHRLQVVRALSEEGIPVCGHLGLLPQSVHRSGGYRVQGRDAASARALREDALALQEAGAVMLVLECIPTALAAEITRSLAIPVIGIGAGPDCDGQVLVLYDVLGITPGGRPRFTHDFLHSAGSLSGALSDFVRAVKVGTFPGPEHCYP
jgi:3-methyl-2-oxobutanoate hydroxymethyltransferase